MSRLVLVGEQERRAVDQVADQLARAERELLARVGDERVAALPALLGVAEHAVGVVGADQDVRRRADLRRRSARARPAAPRSSRPGRRRRTARRWCRWCRRTEPCGGCRRSARSRSPRRAAPATSGSRRSRRRRSRPAPGGARAGPGRSTCWPRRRRAGSRGRRPGRTPRACAAARRRGSPRTSRRRSSGGRWQWTRRSTGSQQYLGTSGKTRGNCYRRVVVGVPIGRA